MGLRVLGFLQVPDGSRRIGVDPEILTSWGSGTVDGVPDLPGPLFSPRAESTVLGTPVGRRFGRLRWRREDRRRTGKVGQPQEYFYKTLLLFSCVVLHKTFVFIVKVCPIIVLSSDSTVSILHVGISILYRSLNNNINCLF